MTRDNVNVLMKRKAHLKAPSAPLSGHAIYAVLKGGQELIILKRN
jgi:hypothetical protein